MSSIYRPSLAIRPAFHNPQGDRDAEDAPPATIDQLQQSLLSSLSRNSIVNALKSQMRAKLIAQLRERHLPEFGGIPGEDDPARLESPAEAVRRLAAGDLQGAALPRIVFRALDSAVLEYLAARKYEFARSVLLPESGFSSEADVLQGSDVAHVLQLERDSVLMRRVAAFVRRLAQSSDAGVADSLLAQLFLAVAQLGRQQVASLTTQTDLSPEEMLELKLCEMDARQNQESRDSKRESDTVRLQRLEQQLAVRLRDELELSAQKSRDMEVAQVRMEERRRHQADVAQLEARYAARETERARDEAAREAAAVARLRHKEEELETRQHENRQRLLDELEAVKRHEETLKRETEVVTREGRCREKQLETKVDELLITIQDLEKFKGSFDGKVAESVAEFKREFERNHALELSHLRTTRATLAGEKDVLAQQKLHLDTQLSQLSSLSSQAAAAQEELRQARTELQVTQRELAHKDQIVRELGVQARLGSKDRKAETLLEFEVAQLRQQLAEAEKTASQRQSEHERLLKSLLPGARGDSAHQALQDELLQARRSEEHWKAECEGLVGKLEHELARSLDLQQSLDDERLRAKELNRELSDLRLVLHQTQTAYLHEMDFKHGPKIELPGGLDGPEVTDETLRATLERVALRSRSLSPIVRSGGSPGPFVATVDVSGVSLPDASQQDDSVASSSA